MKIKKVLVANRGEIACRIIKTLRKMDIMSVAVFSEADTNSLHVEMADESFCIGSAQSTKSYLNLDSVCEAIIASKADAVHPGFGFLSENCQFVQRLQKMGIRFIGPNTDVVKKMGDKIEAKKIAVDAGVSVVQGYIGEAHNLQDVVKIASSIGFPIIIKAAAGGGGKGMRIINSVDDIEEALILATSEAEKSFGDSRVFVERYMERPRHIEIQVLADKFGNVVCLGERECSIQRRYQKVVEEAPSFFVNEQLRYEMYEQAVLLAKKVGYYSAGTIEFIMDKDRNFYFLEMNTRIQVEHPVTELVTGIDLIEEMIKIEEGEELNVRQSDIEINGHALEVRVYAEDPANNFLPASGIITHYIEPENMENVRIDTGVQLGSEVTMFYDSMLVKICTHSNTRERAIFAMQQALREFYILGVENNISFLQSIINNPKFISGDIYTGFIQDYYPDGFISDELTSEIKGVFAAVILYVHLNNECRNSAILGDVKLEREWFVKIDDYLCEFQADYAEGSIKLQSDDRIIRLSTNWYPGQALFKANINGCETIVKLLKYDLCYILSYNGYKSLCNVYTPEASRLLKFVKQNSDDEDNSVVISPISGMITKLYVAKGSEVKIGQPLFIIEAMKMENTIYAKGNAKISEINFKEGDQINVNDTVIRFCS